MTRWPTLTFTMLFTIAGCDGPPPARTRPAAKKATKAEPKKLGVQPVKVQADEFASVQEALAELDGVLAMPDGAERNRAEIRVQSWLALQQDKAVPLIAQRASDTEQSIAVRITACRILGALGPGGTDTLIALASKDDSNQLRRKAIETLGAKKPPEKKSIARLIALLDDPDSQVQWQVIDALIKIGEPAKAASGKLNELRQNHADESIRVSAGEALKKVDPRQTFAD